MKVIPLTKGKEVQVDDSDFLWLSRFRWAAVKTGGHFYAVRWLRRGRCVFMHRMILGLTDGSRTDHRDGNGLNNQRSNLRVSSKSQNAANAKLNRRNKSGFKGVAYYPRLRLPFQAFTIEKGRRCFLGAFETAQEAAIAYDRAAQRIWGDFAKTNADLGLL